MEKLQLVADIKVAEQLDRLVLTARGAGQQHALSGALRTFIDPVAIQVTHGSVSVAGHLAAGLLAVDNMIDLRWGDEAKQFVKNRCFAQRMGRQTHEEVQRIILNGRPAAERHLSDVLGRLESLDDHQWVNVAAMTLPGSQGLCVFDEQGAGKTVTLIFAFDVLVTRDEVDFVLIVAPKSMVPEWPNDFVRFKGDNYRVSIVGGSPREKRVALASGSDVMVTNFESTVSMESEFTALLRRYGGRAMLVVDESFYAKNLDARRTRSLRRLREWCGRAYVLCGTPAPNMPQDLIQQFNLVDFGVTFAGLVVPEDREQAHHVIQQAINERGPFIRHLKQDVLPDLPEKGFNRVLLELPPQQAHLYEEASKSLILDLQTVDEASFRRQLGSFLARRSALLQICSNPRGLSPNYSEVSAKLQALDKLLDELIVNRCEKVVLWSFYTGSIETIVRRYARMSPVRYDGTITATTERRAGVKAFQEDDHTMLFVGNPAAAGAGLTLHRSRIAIYESMSNQAAHYLQSVDRIHRRGQVRPVEYYILLCNNTIEVQEYERLLRKERAAQHLFGDEVSEYITRESMLSELLMSLPG